MYRHDTLNRQVDEEGLSHSFTRVINYLCVDKILYLPQLYHTYYYYQFSAVMVLSEVIVLTD